jgi:ribosomal protein S12 methylthiotransferase accessory factor
VCDMAVDPATLGQYSRAQLDHPHARVWEYGPEAAMDWAFGYQLDNGEARLLPADVAFYGYQYPERPHFPKSALTDAPGPPATDSRRVRFFAESSSGCALGSSLEEAALHALVELIERDAFLLAWCRRMPLPAISHGSVDDPASRMLLDTIAWRGFDVHLLSTTYDLGLPTIWALAVNRDPRAVPATYSAAGSSPVPAEAARAALWELAQLVAAPVDWDVRAVEGLVDDPSRVDTIEDHVQLYAMPAMRDRVTEVLGGPTVTLASAFPEWPDRLCQAAQGDVWGALRFLLAGCRDAGLDQAIVVDQSTREHRDLGLSVARMVVPGILPMCFGSPQQRLSGLSRRDRALAAAGRTDPGAAAHALLFDPHPFP